MNVHFVERFSLVFIEETFTKASPLHCLPGILLPVVCFLVTSLLCHLSPAWGKVCYGYLQHRHVVYDMNGAQLHHRALLI